MATPPVKKAEYRLEVIKLPRDRFVELGSAIFWAIVVVVLYFHDGLRNILLSWEFWKDFGGLMASFYGRMIAFALCIFLLWGLIVTVVAVGQFLDPRNRK